MSNPEKSFSAAFGLAEAIETAISDAARGTWTIRPDLVAIKILHEHPELGLGEAEIAAAVVEAAGKSGLSLQVLLPG